MTLNMTKAEREAFLSEVHVAIVAVASSDRAPLAVPVWYAYEAGGDVVFMTGEDSEKARLMRAAGRATLVVQREALPYAYVSVEGPVTFEPGSRDETAGIAVRYLGEEGGRQYMQSTADAAGVKVRLRPEHWRTEDYGKR